MSCLVNGLEVGSVVGVRRSRDGHAGVVPRTCGRELFLPKPWTEDRERRRAAGFPRADPADVAAQALYGIETGLPEILADETSRYVGQSLAASPNAA